MLLLLLLVCVPNLEFNFAPLLYLCRCSTCVTRWTTWVGCRQSRGGGVRVLLLDNNVCIAGDKPLLNKDGDDERC